MISEQQVRKAMKDNDVQVDADAIPTDVPFVDLGMDSLDFFNVVAELQDITGREIPDEDIDRLRTIDGIIDYFKDWKPEPDQG